MSSEVKIHARILTVTLCVVAVVMAYHWAADKFRAPPVVAVTQQSAQTVQGVQQAAVAAKVPLSSYQAAELAQAVERSATKPPDQIVQTTGSAWEKMAEKIRKQSGADMVMVTDPKRPNEKPAPKKDEPVNLNVYNIKAYPKDFQQVGFGPDAVLASANWQIAKTKTKRWYLGAWGVADLKKPEQSKIGIMLTRM